MPEKLRRYISDWLPWAVVGLIVVFAIFENRVSHQLASERAEARYQWILATHAIAVQAAADRITMTNFREWERHFCLKNGLKVSDIELNPAIPEPPPLPKMVP